jgi:hypothetical protein
MQLAIFVLLVILIAAVVGGAAVIVRSSSAPKEVLPSPSVDLGQWVEAVKAAIDVGAISTGVQGAVESKIHEAATKVLSDANENARKLAEERGGCFHIKSYPEVRHTIGTLENYYSKLSN